MQQLGGLEQEGMLTAPGALWRLLPNSSAPGKGNNKSPSFSPPLREGLRLTHRNPPVHRLQLRLPLELPCPFPGPAAARPAHTNGAHELLKSFLRALFLRSRSQRPPVATCQSQGLITCAGLGAAHSSPASPCKMLTSGRWAPHPPAGSTEGTRGGEKHDPHAQLGQTKNTEKWKKKWQGTCRCSSAPPQGIPRAQRQAGRWWQLGNCGEIKIYVSALTCLGKWEWGGAAREEDGET